MMDAAGSLSVILVNWNTPPAMLEECLVSLREHTPSHRAMEVILVDNASTNGTPEMVRERFGEVRLIANPENRNYTVANNQGLAAARGRLLLCLNTDTIIHAGALDRLCGLAEARPDIGICSAQLLNTDGTPQGHYGDFWSTRSVTAIVWHLFLIPALRPLIKRHRRDDEPAPRPCCACDEPACPHRILYTDALFGACQMVRRDVYERIGPQDEAIAIWGGDMDWCFRAARAGYRQAVLTCSRITHHGGGSTVKTEAARGDNRARMWEQYRAYVEVVRKHQGRTSVWGVKLGIGSFAATYLALMLPLLLVPPLHRRAHAAIGKCWGTLCRLLTL
jgi:hypothetical protein